VAKTETERLQDQVLEMDKALKELVGELERIMSPPFMTAQVTRVIEKDDLVEVSAMDRLLYFAPPKDPADKEGKRTLKVKPGDQVYLDKEARFIVKVTKIPPVEDKPVPQMPWHEIGGLAEAKEVLQMAVEVPMKNPEIFKKYGQPLTKGVALHGPPGNGKTLLGRAVATSIASMHGNATGAGFIYVKGPEVLSMFVGEAERRIREMFYGAQRYKEKHGHPAVIFIDEAEAILRKRGTGVSSDILDSIVPSFLAEMDGCGESGAFLMLATNRIDMLDDAVLRPGRIDVLVKVPRPSIDESAQILGIHMKDTPTEVAPTDLVQKHYDSISKIVSGALLAEWVRRARELAIRRDLAAQRKNPSGVVVEDFTAAITKIREEPRYAAAGK